MKRAIEQVADGLSVVQRYAAAIELDRALGGGLGLTAPASDVSALNPSVLTKSALTQSDLKASTP